MRTSTIIRLPVIALLAAGALAVAACGEEDPSGGGSSASGIQSETKAAMLAYARCMREHGVDLPDPTFESGGPVRQAGPDEDTPPEKLREANKACAKVEPDVEPPELTKEEQQGLKDAALAHSRCMREHGIEDFPDPEVAADGTVELMIEPGGAIDPDAPDFREAQQACRDEMPVQPSEEPAP